MPLDIPQFVAKKNAAYGDMFLLLVEIEYAPGQFVRWARLGRGESSITFEGQTWVAFGLGNPRRSQNSRGQIPMFELPIANPKRIFQSTLQSYIVEGRPGRLITVDRANLSDPTAKAEEWFTVQMATPSPEMIVLTCQGLRFNPIRSRIPRTTMTRTRYPGLAGSSRNRYY